MSKVTFTLVFLFAVLPSFVDPLGHLRGTKKDSASTSGLTACCSGGEPASDDEDFSDDDGGDSTGGDSTTATTTTTEWVCEPEDVNPPLNKRSYSHHFNLKQLYGQGGADMALFKNSLLDAQTARAAWIPQVKQDQTCCKHDAWMTIDLGSIRKVRGVITQGISGSDKLWQCWTKSFQLSYSKNGNKWFKVDDHKLFTGNTNTWGKKKNNFDGDIDARYITFYPKGFHTLIAMRAGLIVCK